MAGTSRREDGIMVLGEDDGGFFLFFQEEIIYDGVLRINPLVTANVFRLFAKP